MQHEALEATLRRAGAFDQEQVAVGAQVNEAYIVMTYTVMVYTVMAYTVMAYIVYSYGLYSYGLYSHGCRDTCMAVSTDAQTRV